MPSRDFMIHEYIWVPYLPEPRGQASLPEIEKLPGIKFEKMSNNIVASSMPGTIAQQAGSLVSECSRFWTSEHVQKWETCQNA
jgi:hypothetical protein